MTSIGAKSFPLEEHGTWAPPIAQTLSRWLDHDGPGLATRRVCTESSFRELFPANEKVFMSAHSEEVIEAVKPTYLGRGGPTRGRIVTDFNNVSVDSTDYRPVWLDNLAVDVTVEGSMMNGAVQDPKAVRSIVAYIRTLYESQEFNFAGSYGDNAFVEDYSAAVRGEPIGGVILVSRNAAGQAQHIVANHRPPVHAAALVPAGRRSLRRHSLRRAFQRQR